ncbi:MAG: hypothetical protein ACR2NA_12325 [Solirubrobacterales bacterium]
MRPASPFASLDASSTRRLAWATWGLVVLSLPVSLVLGVVNVGADLPADREDFLFLTALMVGMTAVYGTVGAVVATRAPRNAIGWLFLLVAVCLGFLGLAYGYGDYALYGEGRGTGLPLVGIAAWTTEWMFILPVFVLPCFVMLLFPDGSLPSPRWRPVGWLLGATTAGALLGSLGAGPLGSFPDVQNPLAPRGTVGTVLDAVNSVGEAVLAPLAFAGAIAALVARFRRSRGRERAQLKWLTYAGTVMMAAFVALFVAEGAVPVWASDVLFFTGFGSFGLIPVAAGIAILRYRLYDIDVVINRTLVYATLTAALVATYVTGVLVLQLALSPLTEDNGLAIAGSTLAVAALARPARRNIQAAVDRRFYRRRYDAARTLDAFGIRLRGHVELETLGVALRDVAAETMQPEHVSVWLRKPEVPT